VERELARLEGLRLELLAGSADVAEAAGGRSAGAWLAVESRHDARARVHDQRLAEAIARRPVVLAALRSGAVNAAQADVVVRALDALPADLDAELVAKAEAQVVADAGQFGPRELRVLGRRVLEVVAPDVADAQEAALLVAEERRARAETRVTFRPRADGVTDVWARVPDHVGDRLRSYLDAFTSPRRTHLDPTGADDVSLLTLPRRRGVAFCSLLEQLPADRLPLHGGTATSVVVTLDFESLVSGEGVGGVSTGGRITATEARRLACTARILPAVLGGAGEILDPHPPLRLHLDLQHPPHPLHPGIRPTTDLRCRLKHLSVRTGQRQGPSRLPSVVAGRADGPRRWSLALLVPPPPRPRSLRLAVRPPDRWAPSLPPKDVSRP
jgi:hypothetical protein